MGMVEIIVDFIKHGGNISKLGATHLCLIIETTFRANRNNFSIPNSIPSLKTEAGQQHLAQFKKKN
jgi:hypothetical protein